MASKNLIRTGLVAALIGLVLFLSSASKAAAPAILQSSASRLPSAGDVARRILSQRVQTNQKSLKPAEDLSLSDTWIDTADDLPLTSYDGGSPGYTVWSNLYLSTGTLLAVTADDGSQLPPPRHILSGEKEEKRGFPAAGDDRWRVEHEEVVRGELGRTAILLPGTTYIFNDVGGGEGYLIYFMHFAAEAFLGGTRALASTTKAPLDTPARIWFPRCTSSSHWRDGKGENVWFLSHMLPGAVIEDAHGWEDRLASGLPYVFEKVVIIDRWSAHGVGGEVGKWGKMNAAIASVPASSMFWEPFRYSMLRSLGAEQVARTADRGLPVVVYVDRQRESQAKLAEADHKALVEGLKRLTPFAEVHVTKLSTMSKLQQIELLSRTEILISCHGDELLNALWMKQSEGSAVIEIFEEGGFTREYELLSSSLNHRYYAIHNDRILAREDWEAIGGKRGPGQTAPYRVDAESVVDVVRERLRAVGPVGFSP